MKTLTPRRQQSKGEEEIEIVDISSRVETTESYHDSESAGSPVDVPPPRGNAHIPSYPLRRRIKKDPEDFDDASSLARVPRQPSLPRRSQVEVKAQLKKMKINRPLHEMSRSSEERELYDASSNIERREGSDAFDCAGPPVDTRLPGTSQSMLTVRVFMEIANSNSNYRSICHTGHSG